MGCPLTKSDHATIEFNINEEIENQRNEEHHAGRLNYCKADFDNTRKFFQEERWDRFLKATGVQEKWDEFLKIYKEGEKKFVPKKQTVIADKKKDAKQQEGQKRIHGKNGGKVKELTCGMITNKQGMIT